MPNASARVQLTNSYLLHLERHLSERGRSLDKPREVWDAQLIGLLVRRQPTGSKLWYFDFIKSDGRTSRVSLGRFPALSVDEARTAAKLPCRRHRQKA